MQTLWLALYLPQLPLDAHPHPSTASVVVEHGRVIACDALAAAAGVRTGMKPSLVRSLAPAAAVLQRNALHEAKALDALACWAARLVALADAA